MALTQTALRPLYTTLVQLDLRAQMCTFQEFDACIFDKLSSKDQAIERLDKWSSSHPLSKCEATMFRVYGEWNFIYGREFARIIFKKSEMNK